MKKNILYIPLDERPCNLDYVVELFENQNIISPSKDILGFKKKSANKEAILEFLKNNYSNADSIVISMDMLYFGGLLPSRIYTDLNITEWVDKVSETLKEIKTLKPEIKIYAFQLIMRTPQYNSSDEEPDYYEQHGLNIFKYGVYKHKTQLGIEEVKPEVPMEYINDYEQRRMKNISSLQNSLVLLKNNVFEYFIIPQDDSHEYGYTALDQILIKDMIKNSGIENVLIYPGADEVGAALIGRSLSTSKTKAFLIDSSLDGIKSHPKYEDRPQEITFASQLEVANIELTNNLEEADYVIALNTCPGEMVESWEWQENKMDQSKRSLNKFVADIKKLSETKKVIVLDVAYSNGGDPELVKSLNDNDALSKLHGYFAWNTSSNTMGFGLGLLNAKAEDTLNILKKHLLDDFAYQTMTRWRMYKEELAKLDLNYFDLKDRQEEVIAIEKKIIKEVISKYLNTISFEFDLYHPWNRMFENKMEIK